MSTGAFVCNRLGAAFVGWMLILILAVIVPFVGVPFAIVWPFTVVYNLIKELRRRAKVAS